MSIRNIMINRAIRDIVEKIPDNVFIYGTGKKEGICLYANENFKKTLKDDPTGKHLRDILTHKTEEEIQEIIEDHKNIARTHAKEKDPEQKYNVPGKGFYVYQVEKFRIPLRSLFWKSSFIVAGIGKDITEIFLAKEKIVNVNQMLASTNEELITSNEELSATNEELAATNDALLKTKEELENTNKQLQDANQQLNQFMKHVLHDIKNPINAINWFSDLMQHYIEDMLDTKTISHDDFERLCFFIDVMKQSSKKVYTFLEDLNEIWSLKRWSIRPEIKNFPTKDFFEKIYHQQCGYLKYVNEEAKRKDKPEKEIAIVFDTDNNLFPKEITSDEKLLERILTNLIGNAIKFTDTWSITISAEKKGKDLIFSVSDTGVWIHKKDHEKIFKEFQCANSEYQSVIEWTGLWLPIVLKMVGVLWGEMLPIKSEIGKWSTFSFKIPVEYFFKEN